MSAILQTPTHKKAPVSLPFLPSPLITRTVDRAPLLHSDLHRTTDHLFLPAATLLSTSHDFAVTTAASLWRSDCALFLKLDSLANL